jgi:hypothetical protein
MAGMAKERDAFGGTVAGIIGAVLGVLVDKLLPWEQLFEAFPVFPRILIFVAIVLFVWMAARYYEILGGADEPPGSSERADCDEAVAALNLGGTPAKVYREWLTAALNRVDAFFGDAGRDDKSWFARALGLETPGARWTAPAFDRCLLLALIYPIFTIYIVWVWSGQVGVAERALSLWEAQPDNLIAGLRRLASGVALLVTGYAIWRANKVDGALPRPVWLVVACACAFAFGFAVGGDFAVALGFAGAYVVALAGATAVAVAVAVAFGFAFAGAFAVAGAVAVLVAVVAASMWSVENGIQGWFLSALFLVMTFAVFAIAWFAAPLDSWRGAGALLLVFGLLTLVNAPFDWFAIGLTRALLRRGLAPGGRGPYFYAAVDALVAIPVIALLAFVSVLAVQTFDDIAALRAGPEARIMPLDKLFPGLDLHPGDPEYWWIWLMLFSTLIPSATNLCIAAASLMRGAPFLNEWILARMPMDGGIRIKDRRLLTGLLAGQIAGGVLATGLALYFLGAWLLPMWLPTFGAILRYFSEALAAYDAPGRVMHWFTDAR